MNIVTGGLVGVSAGKEGGTGAGMIARRRRP